MDAERAIEIARLWKAGKMIGADENEVRDALLAEIERLRLAINDALNTPHGEQETEILLNALTVPNAR